MEKIYSIKIERKEYIEVDKKTRKDIERLLRKAKLDNNKDEVMIFGEMLYTGKLVEDKENKEKHEFYSKLVLNQALRSVDKLSQEIEAVRKKLIDEDNYFEFNCTEGDLVKEDTEIIEISSSKKLKEYTEYTEDIDSNMMDLVTNKMCEVHEEVIAILNKLKIKFKTKKIESYKTKAKNSIRKALCELVIWLKTYKRIVMFSGGKDSTAMLLKLIEEGEKIDKIVFADTGLEFPDMYRYIERVQDYIKKEITIVKGDVSFDQWFYSPWTKGKKKGQVRGFPQVVGLGCWAKRELKIKPLKKAEGKGNEIFIGIAADEKHRIYREEYQHDNIYRLPLVEWGMNEKDCINMLKERNLLNPLYTIFKRLGCWLCPKQGMGSLKKLYQNYPDLWDKLKKYEVDSPTGFKINATLEELEQRFKEKIFIEQNQISMF
ncbi:phosphoadenosine phosphosulfate reductase family protein [Clostridium massiliodielmoense]|uniref:phosphoadenosine phosphosulfate reductase domain-containing protein n=1 Tax=Clostridium massiliodielmoense TaxID=1776385 RepID=UPI000A26E0BE|nr:phosphoadenosine phosphosulfate reductase family protein [Clostridium massiliodielmoense]